MSTSVPLHTYTAHVEALAQVALDKQRALDEAQRTIDGLLVQLEQRGDELAALKARTCATCCFWQRDALDERGFGGCLGHLGRTTPMAYTTATHGCRSWLPLASTHPAEGV